MRISFLLLLGFLGASPAFAEGYSTDIELVQPGFSVDSIPGVDTPSMYEAGTWRIGMLGQYEQDPLVLYDSGYEVGPVVENRAATHFGLTYDIARNASARLVVPGYFNVGTQVPAFAAEGGGMGDIALAVRFQALKAGPLTLGVRGDLVAPTGKKEAYIGDSSLRTGGALLGQLTLFRVVPVDLLVDVGAQTRGRVDTEEDFLLGSELVLNGGLRVAPVRERVWLFGGVLNRGGFRNFWDFQAAENPLEVIGGVQVAATNQIQVDVGAGKGLTDGYGTTQQRFFAGITYRFVKPEPPPLVIDEPPPPPPPTIIEEEPEIVTEWQEGELAKQIGQQIVIKDPIQFEFNTERILPESIPTLRYVARLINGNDRIGHIVIEGHASEEGSFEYNYDLSIRRARAVWEQLILSKVHPDRISYRGMGEVEPRDAATASAAAGATEAELAENRRVEFHIIYQLGELDLAPQYPTDIKLPWSGTEATATQPPPNQTVNAADQQFETAPTGPKKEDPKININLFEEEEEGGDEEAPAPPPTPAPEPAPDEGGGEPAPPPGEENPEDDEGGTP